jgi:MYXO-CTERM domain-containing protein
MGSCVATPDAGVDASMPMPDAGVDAAMPPAPDAGSDATMDSGHVMPEDAGHVKTDDAGRQVDAGQTNGHDAGGDATTAGAPAASSSGCGCRTVGGGSNGEAAFWTLAGLGLVVLRKRSRRLKR